MYNADPAHHVRSLLWFTAFFASVVILPALLAIGSGACWARALSAVVTP